LNRPLLFYDVILPLQPSVFSAQSGEFHCLWRHLFVVGGTFGFYFCCPDPVSQRLVATNSQSWTSLMTSFLDSVGMPTSAFFHFQSLSSNINFTSLAAD
jgi:hypothetical protein